jgi:hypothetical protein
MGNGTWEMISHFPPKWFPGFGRRSVPVPPSPFPVPAPFPFPLSPFHFTWPV